MQKEARFYCANNDRAALLPLGFKSDAFENALAALARGLPIKPPEIWCAAGSGMLTLALQKAWPDARHHAVLVARKDALTGNATRHVLTIDFARVAKDRPPFPSAPNYDAKVWGVMKQHARPGALFWNVGG